MMIIIKEIDKAILNVRIRSVKKNKRNDRFDVNSSMFKQRLAEISSLHSSKL